MPWPDTMIIGILGRRTDEATLRWALELAGRVAAALAGNGPAPRRTSVEVVPENQLEGRLVAGSREVDLLVVVTAPALITLVADRRRSRAERVGLAAECPTSVGPGMAVLA